MSKFQVVVDADLEAIIPRYFEIRMEELQQMEMGLETGDSETVRMLGHRLKGSGASYGFVRLTDLGAIIEALGKEGDLTAAADYVAEVRAYLDNVEIVFEPEG